MVSNILMLVTSTWFQQVTQFDEQLQASGNLTTPESRGSSLQGTHTVQGQWPMASRVCTPKTWKFSLIWQEDPLPNYCQVNLCRVFKLAKEVAESGKPLNYQIMPMLDAAGGDGVWWGVRRLCFFLFFVLKCWRVRVFSRFFLGGVGGCVLFLMGGFLIGLNWWLGILLGWTVLFFCNSTWLEQRRNGPLVV